MSKRRDVIAATGIATVLAGVLGGCGLLPGSNGTTPVTTPVVSTPAETPSAPVTPSVTPSTTPSTVPAVKATGQLSLHKGNLVSKALSGTCAVVSGKPTITLADHKNDFFGTVDVTIVLVADGGAVKALTADLGEDDELITRKMVFPAAGSSAHLVVSGATYRIAGSMMTYENESKSGSPIPYNVTATCAKSDWLN